jgi:DNA polymerase elongation subunit (family B)
MGVRRGYLPFMPGAMCTTYMGRVSIERVARIIPEQYNGELVYGDTDSNYIHFPDMTSTRECWAFAEKVADEVSALFPAPMRLEFESTIYSRFMILTKKRYMYRSCGKEGVVDNKIGKKGVLLARRDNSQVIRSIYEGLIANIFNGMEKNDVLYYLIQEFNKLCSKSFEKTDFVITKSIGSSTFDIDDIQTVINEKGIKKVKLGDYTVPYLPTEGEEREHLLKLKNAETDEEYYVKCLPAQIQLAEKMRRRGHRVDVGSRIEYVITVQESAKAKQYEKIESYDYYNLHSEIIELDFMHYLKLASNPVDEVLEAVFKIPNFVLNQYNFRLKTRTNMLTELRRLFEPKLIFYK